MQYRKIKVNYFSEIIRMINSIEDLDTFEFFTIDENNEIHYKLTYIEYKAIVHIKNITKIDENIYSITYLYDNAFKNGEESYYYDIKNKKYIPVEDYSPVKIDITKEKETYFNKKYRKFSFWDKLCYMFYDFDDMYSVAVLNVYFLFIISLSIKYYLTFYKISKISIVLLGVPILLIISKIISSIISKFYNKKINIFFNYIERDFLRKLYNNMLEKNEDYYYINNDLYYYRSQDKVYKKYFKKYI